MPTATPVPIVLVPGTTSYQILHAIIARLAALNPADTQLQALVTQYQQISGQPLGT